MGGREGGGGREGARARERAREGGGRKHNLRNNML